MKNIKQFDPGTCELCNQFSPVRYEYWTGENSTLCPSCCNDLDIRAGGKPLDVDEEIEKHNREFAVGDRHDMTKAKRTD